MLSDPRRTPFLTGADLAVHGGRPMPWFEPETPRRTPWTHRRALGRLDGKVAVISGGARGIGAAEARRFVAEGARS